MSDPRDLGDDALGDVLTDLRALADRDAPQPSAELAALFAGGSSAAVPSDELARRRRAGRIVAGAVLAGGVTLGATGVAAAHDALPEPAQSVVIDVFRDLPPVHVDPHHLVLHPARHAAPPRPAAAPPPRVAAPGHAARPATPRTAAPVVPVPVGATRGPAHVPAFRTGHLHSTAPGRHHAYAVHVTAPPGRQARAHRQPPAHRHGRDGWRGGSGGHGRGRGHDEGSGSASGHRHGHGGARDGRGSGSHGGGHRGGGDHEGSRHH